MEWIVFGFMGGLGLIVAIIICVAFYQLKWGKARETHPSRFLYEMTGQAENTRAKTRRPPRGKRGRATRR